MSATQILGKSKSKRALATELADQFGQGQSHEEVIRTLRKLGKFLDSSIRVPGTNLSFGVDPLLGLIPGVGDVLGLAISSYIIHQARRMGVSKFKLFRMGCNVGLETLIGAIPVVGDAFDFAFKANQRNLRIMGIRPDDDPDSRGPL